MYDEGLSVIYNLKDVNKKNYWITSEMFRITQSMDNFLEKWNENFKRTKEHCQMKC